MTRLPGGVRSWLAVIAVCCIAAPPVWATHPTLTGETFAATSGKATGKGCKEAIAGSFSIGTGLAAGPFPGTFDESGQFDAGEVFVDESGTAFADLIIFDARFTIASLQGKVNGFKSLVSRTGTVTCVASDESTFVITFSALLQYHAEITLPDGGTYSDEGMSPVSGMILFNPETGGGSLVAFNEVFESMSMEPPGQPAVLHLEPRIATNPVMTPHTVTAQVFTADGQPVANSTVFFVVQGSTSLAGDCTTGSDGQCSFTYTGPALPGADRIHGFVDTNNNGVEDVGEPQDDVAKAWTLPATTPGHVTGGGQILHMGMIHGVTFGFEAKSDGFLVKGNCLVLDHRQDVQVKCLDATNIVQTPTHATIFGNALVNGVAAQYRIDVDDLNEPGILADMFTIQTSNGYIVGGPLTNGNIQIHK